MPARISDRKRDAQSAQSVTGIYAQMSQFDGNIVMALRANILAKMTTQTAIKKGTKPVQKRPRRDSSLAESRRIDVYLPQAVWAKLNAQATRRKVGVSRMAAEVLTQWAGKGGDL